MLLKLELVIKELIIQLKSEDDSVIQLYNYTEFLAETYLKFLNEEANTLFNVELCKLDSTRLVSLKNKFPFRLEFVPFKAKDYEEIYITKYSR